MTDIINNFSGEPRLALNRSWLCLQFPFALKEVQGFTLSLFDDSHQGCGHIFGVELPFEDSDLSGLQTLSCTSHGFVIHRKRCWDFRCKNKLTKEVDVEVTNSINFHEL